MKLKKIILTLCSFVFAFSVFAQTAESSENSDASLDFSSETVEFDSKKHYFVAAGGMLLTNIVIGSWNRFGPARASWAQVYWDDIKEPWNREIKFDRDWYWTNFVLHPYQGGLYYLAARNSNLNWFESLLISAAGSFIWEYFFETNSPSTNDLTYTPIGGFATGEMVYRLGLEANAKGHKILGYVANPLRLYTDPILKRAPQGPSGLLQSFSLKTGFGLAFANTWLKSPYDNCSEFFPAYGSVGLDFVYDDPYGHDSNTPYSQFELSMQGSAGLGSGEGADSTEEKIMYSINIFSNGMLLARNPDFGENRDTTVGLVLEYDFMWHSFMEFSSLAPGFAIKQRVNTENGAFVWQSHLAGIIMGTADYYYLRRGVFPKPDYVSCDYGYTTGAEIVEKIAYNAHSGFVFDWTVHGYAMYKYEAQKQDCDDTGWEYFAFSQASVEFPVSKKVSLGLSDDFYIKYADYDNVENVFSVFNAVNFYARFKLM
ncbi:DUF3943 domain-containing protein [uncultured Treponema sp.]|uniref:DUF3943 domain-containing protein n=1 Tax=uncultured Treponema sp. TaxID=162155 RepID=UPI0025D7AE10|nr:DUF3943 domain-containing protein [uncultured Treponema sp.]